MEGIKPRKNEIDDIHRPLDLIPPGLSHRHANLNGKCYRVPFIITISELVNHYITADNEHLDYIYGEPALAKCIGTIFLIHGFQDISFGWRNQIPTLIEEGFRTVAIDCIGYEGTVCALPHYPVIGWCWCGDSLPPLWIEHCISRSIPADGFMCYRRPPQYHPSRFRTTPSSSVQTMSQSWQGNSKRRG